MHLLRGAPLTYACIVVAILALLFLANIVLGWTGPTTTPPTGNVNAPINTGTTDQTKNASLGVNGLAVFGNGIMSGSNRYLNWGSTSGSSGYGLRDNGGTMEFKNNSGNWTSFSGGLGWVVSGNDIYNANSGNVGIGTASPDYTLDVVGSSALRAASSQLRLIETDNADPNDAWHFSMNGAALTFIHADASAGPAYTSAMTLLPSGNVGIGQSTPSYGLDAGGHTVRAGAFIYNSDARLKEHVSPLKEGLVKMLALSPVSFVWNDGPRNGEPDIGFIAQEVEEIVPEVVHTDADGMKSVDYPKLVPVLVKAIQENQATIDELKAVVAERKRALQAEPGQVAD